MAEWVTNMKDAFVNVICGKSVHTPVPVEECGEDLQVFASDSMRTVIALDDTSDETSSYSSDLDDGFYYSTKDVTGTRSGPISLSQLQVSYKSCVDMPMRTKAPQGVFFKGELYIGGGYVTESKKAFIIHKYEPIFQLWDQLPSCPLKSFGIASFDRRLVIVGGKEAGNLSSASSNKIYSLDDDGVNWSILIPPMTFARVSPVVIGYDHFLIVAGGNKGSLDYNMEVYDMVSKRWYSAPPLPVKCFRHTSAVSGHKWYLLSQDDGSIKCADIRSLIQASTGIVIAIAESPLLEISDSSVSIWTTLPSSPCRFSLIAIIGGHLLGVAQDASLVNVHSLLYDSNTKSWLDGSKSKLPNLCGSASVVADDRGSLFLFGGEGGTEQYSNKLYKLSLKTISKSHYKNTKPSLSFNFQ